MHYHPQARTVITTRVRGRIHHAHRPVPYNRRILRAHAADTGSGAGNVDVGGGPAEEARSSWPLAAAGGPRSRPPRLAALEDLSLVVVVVAAAGAVHVVPETASALGSGEVAEVAEVVAVGSSGSLLGLVVGDG
jgi:hypothetical protein